MNDTICESCWKIIDGFSFEIDETTVCSECYEYLKEDNTFDDF